MEIGTAGVVIWLLSMVAGVLVGDRRGNPLDGFLWALVLGPIGVLLGALMIRDKRGQDQAGEMSSSSR